MFWRWLGTLEQGVGGNKTGSGLSDGTGDSNNFSIPARFFFEMASGDKKQIAQKTERPLLKNETKEFVIVEVNFSIFLPSPPYVL